MAYVSGSRVLCSCCNKAKGMPHAKLCDIPCIICIGIDSERYQSIDWQCVVVCVCGLSHQLLCTSAVKNRVLEGQLENDTSHASNIQ